MRPLSFISFFLLIAGGQFSSAFFSGNIEKECFYLGQKAKAEGKNHLVLGYEGLFSCGGNRLENSLSKALQEKGKRVVHVKRCWSDENGGSSVGQKCLDFFKKGYGGQIENMTLAGHSFGLQGVYGLLQKINGSYSQYTKSQIDVVTFDGRMAGNDNWIMSAAGTRCLTKNTFQNSVRLWVNFNQNSGLTGRCIVDAINDNYGADLGRHVTLPDISAVDAVCALERGAVCGQGAKRPSHVAEQGQYQTPVGDNFHVANRNNTQGWEWPDIVPPHEKAILDQSNLGFPALQEFIQKMNVNRKPAVEAGDKRALRFNDGGNSPDPRRRQSMTLEEILAEPPAAEVEKMQKGFANGSWPF